MKKLTLGLCLVSSSAALAHNIEYKVCKGDTLQSISEKFHVPGKAILHANDLPPTHHMRAGHFLLIPYVKGKVPAKAEKISAQVLRGKPSHSGAVAHHNSPVSVGSTTVSYVVRNGDQDWSLAKKNGISLHTLHVMNPNIDWDHLQIGKKIQLPGHLEVHRTAAAGKSSLTTKRQTALRTAKSSGVHMPAHWHVVEEGENDWIIAHKAGIRLPLLKSLNEELDLANLQPGQKVRVPGGAEAKLALNIHRIHSSHVAINGDNVTVRGDAGLHADTICTVDEGTHAAVIDQDGNWYELKFPKGTVGWVRGDLLRPIHEVDPEVVARHDRHREMEVHERRTEVAQVHHEHHEAVASRSHRHSVSHYSSDGSYSLATNDVDPGDAQGVLHEAHQMRGTRYSWGSMSRGATDCSGLVVQVFRKNGYHLPRTSSEQSTVGERVAYKDLKPGDLIFFHTMRGRRVSHVAIYEGNHKFIHASSGGGKVQENSLDEGYYSHRLVTARRLIKHKHESSSGESYEKSSGSKSEPVKDAASTPSDPPETPVTAR
jgi:cell wall-associated NlpC family hydrolase/LysM repeat protein